MASPAQITANQQNPIKHGLTSTFRLLATEDPAKYNALLEVVQQDMQPDNAHEHFLVERMAQCRWNLQRIQVIETSLFERMLSGESVEKQLSLMLRYTTAAERSYIKAHKEIVGERRAQLKTNSDAMNYHIRHNIFGPLPGESEPEPAPSPKPAVALPLSSAARRAQRNALHNYPLTPGTDLVDLNKMTEEQVEEFMASLG